MTTLADEILGALAELVIIHQNGPTVSQAAAKLSARNADVRAAMWSLDATKRALFIRYGGSRLMHLVPLDHDLGRRRHACANCRVVFEQPPKRTRVCCGRSCGAAWSWKQPGVAQDRKNAIRAQKATPEAIARHAENNRLRWSDPEQRERLRQQNLARWADPATKARLSTAIQAANGSPEARAKWSELRKAMWTDPEFREKCSVAMKAAKATPEARAKFAELLRARWQDPVLRPKYLAAARRNAEMIAERRRNSTTGGKG